MRYALLVAVVFLLGWFAAALIGPRAVSAAARPPDFADVIQVLDPSVVHVSIRTSRVNRNRSRDDGVGGGFVYRADGILVTSRHVVAGAQRILVRLPGQPLMDARLVGSDKATDVAVLKVNLQGLRPLPLGTSTRLRRGAWLLAAGSPYELSNSWSVGIVSGLHRSRVGVSPSAYQDYIQTDAAANLGNSGGPLIDASGQVVGVMTAILSRTGGHQGVGLAVPIEAVRASVDRILTGGTARRPTIGVRVREVRGTMGRSGGLQVTGFEAVSPAVRAGLRIGDVILVAGGEVVGRSVDLQRLVWARRAGELMTLLVRRGTHRFEVRVRVRAP